ncbi:MAG: response regulator transcription factor [Alloacidobacterium sp.]|jgi:DNA-binding NarL/FixJ family response regulator
MAWVNVCLKGAFCNLATVHIFIVDDSEPWRRAVRSLLQRDKDLEVICEGSDGLEAVQKSAELQPDLVLLDIGLPNLNGMEAARQIRKVSPGSKIIFLTSHDSPELVQEALRIGALGFVIKSDAASDLLRAVRAVIRNQRFVPQRLCSIPWMIQDA